jgi:hypothetical protein
MTDDRSTETARHDASDDSEHTVAEARVAVDLGALRVETHGNTLDEAEQTFYRVWEHVTDEMDEMTDAMRDRLGGYQ